eukprot:13003668-Ditylum_brightwellii.AAC.1
MPAPVLHAAGQQQQPFPQEQQHYQPAQPQQPSFCASTQRSATTMYCRQQSCQHQCTSTPTSASTVSMQGLPSQIMVPPGSKDDAGSQH